MYNSLKEYRDSPLVKRELQRMRKQNILAIIIGLYIVINTILIMTQF